MTQKRGRKSKASQEIARVNEIVSTPRISPPEWLTPHCREEFFDIVNSLAADHFRPSDAPLLARYCQTIVACNSAADSTEFAMLARLQASLAVKLRLCPSTRGHHRTTARQEQPGARRKPWEDD